MPGFPSVFKIKTPILLLKPSVLLSRSQLQTSCSGDDSKGGYGTCHSRSVEFVKALVMAGFIGKMVMKKIFKEKHASKPEEDPYYNKVPTKTMGFSHTKREKKALPPGLTTQEQKILKKAKARAYALDMCFIDKGPIQLGWSSVIGLVPAFGDVLDLLLALFVYRTCCSVEPPLNSSVRTKMQLNLVIDFFIGLVPFIGDLADAAYKCNTKNVILLEDALVKRAKVRQTGAGDLAETVTSGPNERNQRRDQHETSNAREGQPDRHAAVKKPERPEQTYDPERSEGRAAYFGGRTEVDLEAGESTPPRRVR